MPEPNRTILRRLERELVQKADHLSDEQYGRLSERIKWWADNIEKPLKNPDFKYERWNQHFGWKVVCKSHSLPLRKPTLSD